MAIKPSKSPQPPKPSKKEGLRKKQIIFLECLAKAKGPLTRKSLCERTESHPTNVTANALGYLDPECRAKRDTANGYPCLLTLGYVRTRVLDIEDSKETVYEITATGRKALEKAQQ